LGVAYIWELVAMREEQCNWEAKEIRLNKVESSVLFDKLDKNGELQKRV